MDASDHASPAAQATATRRLRTIEDKRRIVEETLAPGASVAAVARKHGVNANLLFGWRRLHKQGLLKRCREPAATLLPVKVATLTLTPGSTALTTAEPRAMLRRAARRPRRPSTQADGYVEVAVGDDVVVRIHGRIDPQSLAAVMTALRAR
jgi:transposase